MRRKQIRFVGNCQSNALANFYKDFVGTPAGEDVVSIDDLGLDDEGIRRAVEGADVVVVQERDFKRGLTQDELGGAVEVFTFPLIMAGFLWPFANEPHVHNMSERPISDGPYPSQMGDSFLNRLVTRGVPPEEALEQYLALDIARVASLDRMCEIYLDRQRQRDTATGFALTDFIEANFRERRLFLTAEHPDAELFGVAARQLFDKMGVSPGITERALGTLFRTPFPPTELPLHPGVVAHFGLRYADHATRYVYLDEGRFTFDEYVLRYMRYENNPGLRKAIYMVDRQPSAETLAQLEAALPMSPGAARGLAVKGTLLLRLNRADEAVAAYRAAVAIEPDRPENPIGLARALVRANDLREAEAWARNSIAIAPLLDTAHLALAEVLIAARELDAAVQSAAEALRLTAHKGEICYLLAIAMLGAGRIAEAEDYARSGWAAEPRNPVHVNVLAEALEQQGRRPEALTLLDTCRIDDVANDQTYSLLGNFWMRDGAFDRAEQAFEFGAQIYGRDRPDLVDCLRQAQQLRQGSAAG